MIKSTRGRPKGSYSYNNADTALLSKVAEMLVRANAKSPTAAIKNLIGEDRESELRRLQRRWSRDGNEFIRKAREPFSSKRWEKEAKDLKAASQELYGRYLAFAKSPGGKRILLEKGDGETPVHFMSLGIAGLNQLVEKHQLHGTKKADGAFKQQYAQWCEYGSEPDPEFLRAFAKLCLEKAKKLETANAKIRGKVK